MGVIQGDTRSVDYGSHPIIVLRPSTRLGGIIARCVDLYGTFPKEGNTTLNQHARSLSWGHPKKVPPPPILGNPHIHGWATYSFPPHLAATPNLKRISVHKVVRQNPQLLRVRLEVQTATSTPYALHPGPKPQTLHPKH